MLGRRSPNFELPFCRRQQCGLNIITCIPWLFQDSPSRFPKLASGPLEWHLRPSTLHRVQSSRVMSPPRINRLTALPSASQSVSQSVSQSPSLIFHRSSIQMEWFRQSSSSSTAALFVAFREMAVHPAVGRWDGKQVNL